MPQSSTGSGVESVHLLVDGTEVEALRRRQVAGRKEWQEGPRSWRELHTGMDANTGEIIFAAVTMDDVGDTGQVGPLLDQVAGPVAAPTADGAYGAVPDRDTDATIIVPPRWTAVLRETAQTAPRQRDGHLRCIDEKGRMGWQKMSGNNKRTCVEAAIGRYKQMIDDRLPFSQGRPSYHEGCRRRPCLEPDAGAGTARSLSASHELR